MTSHVLLIEDDRDLREALQCYMLRRGNRVTACASISEAREAMVHIDHAAIAPDTVLSDVGLPDGNGIDFYMEQSARFPSINWVLMSGNPDLVCAKPPANGPYRWPCGVRSG